MARLKKSRASDPGIGRVSRGRGFTYLDARQRPIEDVETRERIRALAIPPAWTDVWICADPRGHLQAVGTDAAGRRQYLYHAEWRERRDVQKFRRVEGFAEALPSLRKRVAADIALDGLPRARVLACAVRMLDEASFRIGSETYAEQNGSFGLATMRKRHATLEGDHMVFEYVAKSGKVRRQVVRDQEAVTILKELKERHGGGRELLAYRDEHERWRDVRSTEINDYLRCVANPQVAEAAFTAKDFRTWQATVLASVLAASAEGDLAPGTSRKRVANGVVRDVADYLGNTPAVARNAYIDPRVFERFYEGVTVAERLRDPDISDLEDPKIRTRIEAAVLALLRGELRSTAIAA